MARNEEKAMSMMNRFRQTLKIEAGIKRDPTLPQPKTPAECTDLLTAEHYRRIILKTISRTFTQLQDPNLDEHQLRLLNDTINKQIREKHEWDVKVKELGGQDLGRRRGGEGIVEGAGVESRQVKGYRYFGRAKELPEVLEMMRPQREERTRVREELFSNIDAEYYGYEHDSDLCAEERAAEERIANGKYNCELDWVTQGPSSVPLSLAISPSSPPTTEILEFPSIPSQSEVEAFLIERKRKELLHKLSI